MEEQNFFDASDLEDLFAQLDEIEEPEVELSEEEIASKRRYDEIIKKHQDKE